MEKKNIILLTVIAVATLLITVVGATFAYFAATITNNGDDQINTTTIKSASGLSITYNGGETITVSNILPGWGETYDKEKSNKITISNDTAYAIEYTLKWQDVTNSFTDQDNLGYKAEVQTNWITPDQHSHEEGTSVSNIQLKKAPVGGDETFATQTLKPGEKIDYTIQFEYKYDDKTEQDSQGAQFKAKLVLDDKTIKVTQPAAA